MRARTRNPGNLGLTSAHRATVAGDVGSLVGVTEQGRQIRRMVSETCVRCRYIVTIPALNLSFIRYMRLRKIHVLPVRRLPSDSMRDRGHFTKRLRLVCECECTKSAQHGASALSSVRSGRRGVGRGIGYENWAPRSRSGRVGSGLGRHQEIQCRFRENTPLPTPKADLRGQP